MPKWTSRSSTVFALLLLLTASAARAQQVDILSDQEPQAPATPAQDPGQKVAEGEEPAKPTRAFFPALLHDLGDDVKHMIPRPKIVIRRRSAALSTETLCIIL